jgi:hypothetical protein
MTNQSGNEDYALQLLELANQGPGMISNTGDPNQVVLTLKAIS